jgi:hypothetical protein
MAINMPAALDPDGEPKRLNIVAPTSWVRKVNDWRRAQPDMPNLSEAIRRLVETGLDHSRPPDAFQTSVTEMKKPTRRR